MTLRALADLISCWCCCAVFVHHLFFAVCLSLSLCLCLSLHFCLSVSVSVSVSVCLSQSLSVCLSISLSLSVSLTVWMGEWVGGGGGDALRREWDGVEGDLHSFTFKEFF